MLKLNKVAITGGLSCGKSSVCRLFKQWGAYIISADEIVHHLLSSDKHLIQEVINLLGSDIIVNDQINRARIAHIVFHDDQLLQALEQLLHPRVYRYIEEVYRHQQTKDDPPSLFVAEIPLLFESRGEKNYDYTVTVLANPEVCIQRFKTKTSHDEQEFYRRMQRQMPLLDKAIKADYVILNNNSLAMLEERAKELYQELIDVLY